MGHHVGYPTVETRCCRFVVRGTIMAENKALKSSRKNNNRKIKYSIYAENILGAYFKEIACLTPLKKEEEHILGKKILGGDQKSLNELVLRNLKYVVTVAHAYKRSGRALSDLINEGNIGLIQAAFRFDPFKDVKFITYANWWIRQAIRQAVADHSGAVRLPAKQRATLYKINKKNKDFLQKHGRLPTPEYLAKELDLTVEGVESILRACRSHLSLNAPLKNNEGTDHMALLESKNVGSIEDSALFDSLKSEIDKLLKGLSPREEKVLRSRFGFNKNDPTTLEEIGKEMHLSRERVRQIEKKATEHLRTKEKIKILKDFLN